MKVKIHHLLKDLLGLFGVGGFIGGEYKKVIHIDNQPPFGYHIPERVVHETLESCRGVTEAEEHNCWLEETTVGDEGSFPLMSVFNLDIVIPPSYVELDEEFHSL